VVANISINPISIPAETESYGTNGKRSTQYGMQAEYVQSEVQIPVLNIVDATGEKVNKSGIKTVALLGTKYTMEQNFYRDRLEKKYGLKVFIPNETERELHQFSDI